MNSAALLVLSILGSVTLTAGVLQALPSDDLWNLDYAVCASNMAYLRGYSNAANHSQEQAKAWLNEYYRLVHNNPTKETCQAAAILVCQCEARKHDETT